METKEIIINEQTLRLKRAVTRVEKSLRPDKQVEYPTSQEVAMFKSFFGKTDEDHSDWETRIFSCLERTLLEKWHDITESFPGFCDEKWLSENGDAAKERVDQIIERIGEIEEADD